MARFDSIEHLQQAILDLTSAHEPPATIELIDENVLQQIHELNPNQLKEIMKPPFSPFLLLIEFDERDRGQKKAVKHANKLLEKYATATQSETEPEKQQLLWKLRESTSMLIAHNEGQQHSTPMIDGAVPPDRLREYIEGLYNLLKDIGIKPALWGHAGNANVYLQPQLNLNQVGDRQKAFRLLNEYTTW